MQNEDVASFCADCGAPLIVEKAQRTVYEGAVHKCPHCAAPINSFDITCKECGCELRDRGVAKGVKELSLRLLEIESQRNTYKYKNAQMNGAAGEDTIEKEKIALISSFPVPNTKEDIYEFLILASSNFDPRYYATHRNVDDISDAWKIKIDQCHAKAGLILDKEDYARVDEMYRNIQIAIKKAERRSIISTSISSLLMIIGVLMIVASTPMAYNFSPFFMLLSQFGAVVFLTGVVIAIVKAVRKNKRK